MMVPTSSQDTERFVPAHYEGREDAPVFILATLNWRDRARFRAELAKEGIRYPQDEEIARVVAELIEEAKPGNAAELLEAVQAYRDIIAGPPFVGLPEEASDEDRDAFAADLARRVKVGAEYDQVLDLLRSHPRLALLISMRTAFNQIAPPLAASFALRGWERVPERFRRVNGVVPDGVLEALSDADLGAIGSKVMAAMVVSGQQRGN